MIYFAFMCSTKGTLNTWLALTRTLLFSLSISRAAFNVTIFFLFSLLSSQSTWWFCCSTSNQHTIQVSSSNIFIYTLQPLGHDNHLDSIFYKCVDNIFRLSVCISKPNDLNWSILGSFKLVPVQNLFSNLIERFNERDVR